MIAKYNRLSFMYGVPGIVLQIGGYFIAAFSQSGPASLAILFVPFGTIFLLAGLAYYAKAKGQSSAWCVAAFLSILGLLLLLLLEDKSDSMPTTGEEHEKA